MLMKALVEQDQPNQALQVAREGVAKFQKAQDRRQELVMQEISITSSITTILLL